MYKTFYAITFQQLMNAWASDVSPSCLNCCVIMILPSSYIRQIGVLPNITKWSQLTVSCKNSNVRENMPTYCRGSDNDTLFMISEQGEMIGVNNDIIGHLIDYIYIYWP